MKGIFGEVFSSRGLYYKKGAILPVPELLREDNNEIKEV